MKEIAPCGQAAASSGANRQAPASSDARPSGVRTSSVEGMAAWHSWQVSAAGGIEDRPAAKPLGELRRPAGKGEVRVPCAHRVRRKSSIRGHAPRRRG